jgi:hypothetical protein
MIVIVDKDNRKSLFLVDKVRYNAVQYEANDETRIRRMAPLGHRRIGRAADPARITVRNPA